MDFNPFLYCYFYTIAIFNFATPSFSIVLDIQILSKFSTPVKKNSKKDYEKRKFLSYYLPINLISLSILFIAYVPS